MVTHYECRLLFAKLCYNMKKYMKLTYFLTHILIATMMDTIIPMTAITMSIARRANSGCIIQSIVLHHILCYIEYNVKWHSCFHFDLPISHSSILKSLGCQCNIHTCVLNAHQISFILQNTFISHKTNGKLCNLIPLCSIFYYS